MLRTDSIDKLLKSIDRYKELVKKNRENNGLDLTDYKEYRSLEDYIKAHILDAIKDGYSLKAPSKHYVFEFNDKDDSRVWHILCFNGTRRYAYKSFSWDDSDRNDADDFVKEFLKNDGNHYIYNTPWDDVYYDINKEEPNGIYILPDKPLSDLEEYRVYPQNSTAHNRLKEMRF